MRKELKVSRIKVIVEPDDGGFIIMWPDGNINGIGGNKAKVLNFIKRQSKLERKRLCADVLLTEIEWRN